MLKYIPWIIGGDFNMIEHLSKNIRGILKAWLGYKWLEINHACLETSVSSAHQCNFNLEQST